MQTATYTKLRDGSWGIRVASGNIKMGAAVLVRKQSGETKTETVRQVIWHDANTSICSIERAAAPRTNFSSRTSTERTYMRRHGWDGVHGSPSYYSSGMYDEE